MTEKRARTTSSYLIRNPKATTRDLTHGEDSLFPLNGHVSIKIVKGVVAKEMIESCRKITLKH